MSKVSGHAKIEILKTQSRATLDNYCLSGCLEILLISTLRRGDGMGPEPLRVANSGVLWLKLAGQLSGAAPYRRAPGTFRFA